jgi:hypothetical protein
MASSGNIATLNPLHKMSVGTFSNGNLKYAMSGSDDGYVASMSMTKKSYCEVRVDAQSNYGGSIGIRSGQCNSYYTDSLTFQVNYSSGDLYLYKNTTGTDVGDIGGTVSNGNIVMMAYDPATYKWWVGVNGTWRSSGNPATGANPMYTGSATMFEDTDIFWGGWTSSANGLTVTFNFGQDSTFGGQETAGGNADENGFGDFKYAPPTGFLALCSGNLSVSSDIDPAGDDGADDNPTKQFNTVIFDGNGTTNVVTGLGFKPDLIWGFTRSGGQSKRMIDSTRGGSSRMYSDLDSAESTGTATISEFGTDGFTATGGAFNNDSGKTCGSWCWKANGGTTSSNSSGTITSTLQANTKGGFSIITYTGSGSNATIGHGLSSAPDFFLVKDRARAGEYWAVYHSSLGATKYLTLNTNAAAATNSNRWNDTEPTDTLIGLGTNDNTNGSSTYLCYAWHSVEGSSKFGKYTGNGNADGPFIYTGFRPRMLFFKRIDAGHNWITFDTATVTSNANDEYANWDLGTASAQGASDKIDFLSNGFKLRSTGSSFNNSGSDFVYGAWGDVPFKYNNTF